MSRALILLSVRHTIRENIRLAEGVGRLVPKFEAHFLLAEPTFDGEFQDSTFRRHVISAGCCVLKSTKEGRCGNSFFRRIHRLLRFTSLDQLRIYWKSLRKLKKLYRETARIVDQVKPDLIILPGDRHLWLEQVLLKIARERHIRCVVPYFARSDDVSCITDRSPLFRICRQSPWISRLVVTFFPSQVLTHEDQRYLYYEPGTTLALATFGTLSPNPWYIGGGHANVVCMETLEAFERFKNHGVPVEKLRLVGDQYFDDMHALLLKRVSVRDQFAAQYGLDSAKKVILLTMPQYFEHGIMTEAAHWEEIRWLVRELASQGQLVISLHPKMDRKNYGFLEKEFSCRILDERLFKVLPLVDVMVSTISSTVIWAILCGVKPIVLDTVDIGYFAYDNFKSITFVDKRSRLASVVQDSLTTRTDFTADWETLGRNLIFDGNVSRRYARVFAG